MTVLDTIYGKFQTPSWPDDLIVRSLTTYGEWSYAEQQLLSPLIAQGDHLWDGGAFLGSFGLGVAQEAARRGQCPASILAIEPGEALRPYLEKNLAENSPCPWVISQMGIGPESGHLIPQSASDGSRDNHGAIAYQVAPEGAPGAVKSESLRQLRATHGAYQVLKLDIEEMESDALRNDFEFIRDTKPVIWAECNESFNSLQLLEVLTSAGYNPLYVAFPAFRKISFRGTLKPPFPMSYEAVLLAAPSNRLEYFNPEIVGEEVIVKPVQTTWDLRQALWFTPRWSLEEWAKMSKPELVALLARQSQSGDLGSFLN